MRVEELRIGSILSYKDKRFKILEISQSKLKTQSNKGLVLFEVSELEPIKLTEEILLKCGFVKEDLKPSNKHSNYFSIWINDYKYSFSFAYFREYWGFYHSYTDALRKEDNNKFDAISFGIKYLHQLQNLYFALTNKELEINL